MAMKRKLDIEADDAVAGNSKQLKQLKLIPFPNVELDEDAMMCDAEPLYPELRHSRLSSNVSSSSSDNSITNSRMSRLFFLSLD
ncbi:hypothetical protein H0H81_005345 [Sphagnurus paluster]|uniref:Uncharacterized protein n=1 Tax=Sphagnurus paluster TaxID=117069 RepID=A0A9P7FSA5_9AGAR|nr:hypothetical protein H0H81_005345 [Sphagnurus paluster]